MKTTRLLSVLCALISFAYCYDANAALFVTQISQGGGNNWNAVIWSNPPNATATAPAAGNTYELITNGVMYGNNQGDTRVRPPATDGIQTFPGDSLTLNTNTDIRLKRGTDVSPALTICNFPGVNGNPGLILNGGALNPGDDTVFPITGRIRVASDSLLAMGDNGLGSFRPQYTDTVKARGIRFDASLSGSGSLIVAQGVTNQPCVEVTSTDNSYSGNWIVKSGWLKGASRGSLGSGHITLDANYVVSTDLYNPATTTLSNGPILFEANYDLSTPGTLTLNGEARLVLHQNLRFARVFVDGVQQANGTYPYAVVAVAFPAHVTGGGSGSVSIGPVPATGLTAIGRDNAVRLRWTGDASAAGNVIKRSLVAGGPYTPIATNGGAATFADTTAINGTQYFYVVSAFNDGGTTPDSNEASATPVRDPTVAWVSDNPGALGWTGPVSGTADDVFVTNILSGYNVMRFSSDDSQNVLLTQADIDALNTNDVIILGRSLASAAFQPPQGHQWNTNITKPIIVQSAFLIRQSRLGWFAGETANNGVPMRISSPAPSDPESAYLLNLFGTAETSGASTADNYDEPLDQNTSQTTDAPAAGARILASAGTTNVIVEFPAGTAVKGGANILAGYRMFFASGSREVSGIPTAGKDNLTPTGEAIFRRAVKLAINNGVAPNLGEAPVITSQPSSTNACTGLPVILSTTATGENPLYYQWYFSDGATFTNAVAAGTNATLTIASLQAADAGFYVALVTNVVGAATSSVAVVTIAGAATLASVPASQTNCPATPVTFTTTATGLGTLAYTWRKGGTIVQGPDGNSSYMIASVTPADAGVYSVSVAGDCNTVSNNFTLTVVATPTISAQPQNQTTPMGNGAIFSVTSTGFATQPNTFQWQTNGTDVTGANGSTFAISNVTLAANGLQVQVAVSNCAGGLISSAATLTVTPITGISFDFNTPGQWTNAPFNLVGNDWMDSSINSGGFNNPFLTTVPFESPTGGVGVATGGGALDLAFNNGTDRAMTLLPVTYDFSLPGKTLTASIMTKIKVPTAAQRAIQLAFVTTTNVANAWQQVNNNNGQGFMSAIFQSSAPLNVVTPSYHLRAQHKLIAGTGAAETIPINSPTNTLTTNRWYRFVAKFVNIENVTVDSYTVESSVQDMGDNGLTPGPIVLAMAPITIANADMVNSRNLLLAIRGFENGGQDYWDNIAVTTTSGDVAFVDQPASQTVLQGRTASFRALVDGNGPYTYQWNKNGSPIPGAGNWKYTTPQLLLTDDGAQYTVTVTGTNNSITSSAAIVTVTPEALDVLSVGSVNGGEIGLRFDQPVDRASAETAANYTINGTAALAAQLRSYNNFQKQRTNATEVLLTPAGPISGAFTVVVANVTSISGTPLSVNNSATGMVAGLTGFDVDPITQVSLQVGTVPGEEHSFAPGHFEVNGAGYDIFNNFDGFRFVFRQVTGDFDVKMRIPYLDLLRTPNKGGFDARVSLDAYSPNVGTYANPILPGRNFIEGGFRANWNAPTVSWGNQPALTYPDVWLRFRRSGNTFIRYSSTNGVNWSCDGQVTSVGGGFAFPDTLYVGLAVDANVGGVLVQQRITAQFESYGNFGGYPGAAIAITTQPANQTVAAGAAATFTVVNTATGGGIPASAGEVSYLWQRTNSATGGWTNMPTAGGTNNTVSSGTTLFTDNGALYRVILSVPGALSVTSAVATLTVTDTAGPTVAAGLVPTNSPNQIVIGFSEAVTAATALNAANYSVTNGAGTVFAIASVAFLNGDPTRVVLTLASPILAGTYGVLINNLRDLNNNAIAANTVRNLTSIYSAGLFGPIVAEYFGNLPAGGFTTDLLNNVKFLRDTPDYVAYSNAFGMNIGGGFPALGANNGQDNYGLRMFTYFVPTNTGAYKFYLRADDFAEFRMNTNSTGSTNPANLVVAIGTAGAVSFNSPGNEQAYKAMDMNVNTKYLAFDKLNTGFTVTPGIGSNTVVRGMRFATANDAPERDPLTFTLEGSMTVGNNGPWTLIASSDTGFLPLSGNRLTYAPDIVFTNLAGTFSNDTAYVSYRVRFPTVRDSVAANSMQISEVQLLDANRANVLGGAIPQIVLTANNANYTVGNSVTNNLNAGQLYYMELIFKETGGGDGGVIAVRTDATVPAQAETLPGTLCLFPAPLVKPTPAIMEYYTGFAQTDPTGNGNILDLRLATNSLTYLAHQPFSIGYTRYFSYSTNLSGGFDNALGRLFSYFVAPTNGSYKFYMRGDDSFQFFMNTNEVNSTDPLGKTFFSQRISYGDGGSGAWNLMASNITLVAGQRYYMEEIWREGGGGDGASVSVRSQNDPSVPSLEDVIPGSMLEFPADIASLGPIVLDSLLTPNNPTVNEGDTIRFITAHIRSGAPPYNFSWLRNGVQVFANQGIYQTPPLTSADNGAVYTLVVTNLFSAVSVSSTVTVISDTTPPSIASAVASQYGDSVLVTFSEKVDPTTAGNLANYRIPGLTIFSLDYDEIQRNRVSLRTSLQTPGAVYTLTANGVRDLSSAGNATVNATRNFTAWGFGGIGGVYVEIFTNIQNTTLDAFFTDPRYLDNMPDFSYYTNTFAAGLFGAESGLNNYAARISGLFMPPSNGLYRFFVRGDDGTRLFMNTNGPSPAGRVLIARNDGANSGAGAGLGGYQTGQGLGRVGNSISPILSLTNGTAYFMEALMKEGGGGDHLEVLMRAIDPITLTEIGGVPATPAVADGFLGGGFFSAPGNPDLISIVSAPPAELFVRQYDLVDLRVVASFVPPSLAQFVTAQWAKSNANSATFVNIPGATSLALAPFLAPRADDGAAYRIIVSLPGGVLRYTTLLHVEAVDSGISFDFNTPGQWTNAPFNLVFNDWMDSSINSGGFNNPFLTTVPFEVSTGGVGVATGGGALDLAFNNGTDRAMTLLPVTYDFSLTGKVLTASIMTKIKVPTAGQRAIQLAFVTTTNVNNAWQQVNNNDGQGFMSAIFQSTVVNTVTPSYQLRAQHKLIAGTGAAETTPINSPTNTLTTNRWYRFVAKFVNIKNVTAGSFTVESSVQDMGDNGLTPGPIVLGMAPITIANADMVNSRNLLFAIRGFENGGNDYWDNIAVTTKGGNVAFVQELESQTVLQGRTASFRALVDGDGPYTYQWNKNGTPIPGAGNWKYTTPQLTLSDNGAQYTVTVTGPNNSITSLPATVTVTADALDVLSVGSVDGSLIGLRFDQPVNQASAETAANYRINGVAAVAAQLRLYNNFQKQRTNGTEVLLTPTAPISGAFTVTVANVTSISATPLSANNSATGLVAGLTGFDVDPISQINGQAGTIPGYNYSFAPGQFEIAGGGYDIFGTFDGFRFVYKQMTGNFDVKVRVPYLDLLRTPNKGGFDARVSLDAFSPHVGTYANPILPGRNFIEGGVRPTWNSATVAWGNQLALTYPNVWLRFRRSGNTFMRYSSTNGVNWLFDGQTTPSPVFPDTLYVGFAVDANVGGTTLQQLVTAQFESFGNFGGYPGASIAIAANPTNVTINAGNAATHSVTATVSGGGIPASAGELSYLWQRTNSATGGWTNLPTAGATNNTVSSGTLFVPDNGAQYRVIVSAPGALSVTSSVATVTVNDTAVPTIASSSLPVGSAFQIVLTFSEPVSAATATDPANYMVTNAPGTVFGVARAAFLGSDPRVIVVTVDSALVAGNYGITVSGVQDLNGNTLATTVRTFSQVLAPPLLPVVVETIGAGIGGSDLASLGNYTNNARFIAHQPDFISYSNMFAHQLSLADSGFNNYGARVFSLFVAPSNGLYKFWMRSDDSSRLFMNTNGPARAGMVFLGENTANNATYTLKGQNISLTNGQAYYIEGLMKEGGGGDGISVAVRSQGDTATPPATEAIPPSMLAFPAAEALNTPVIVELFTGLAGALIADQLAAQNSPNFIAGIPTFVAYEAEFGAVRDLAASDLNNYLGRLVSYFIPPTNGNYRFYFRSDDSCQFYMNTNAVNSTDPAGKVLLGQIDNFINVNYDPARSAQNIPLVGGQRYYIEGLWKEGGGGDGMTVAVRSQGDAATPPNTEVIPGSMLEFPAALARVGAVSLAGITPSNPTVSEGSTILFQAQGVGGALSYNFAWLRNGVQVFANSALYVTPPLTSADNGAVYTLVVTNLFSRAERSVTVTVLPDATAPTIVSAVGSQYGDSVLVTFSERVDPTTAGCLANYRVGGLTVYGLDLDETRGNRVTLRTSPQTPGTVYTLTVNGVRDLSSAGNATVNATKNFTAWGFGGVGGVYVEYFTNIVGTSVDNLLQDPRFIDNLPDMVHYTNVFAVGPFNADSGLNNYGARVSGLFMAPSNGLYRFFVRGDDGTRLFMNTNGPNPAGRVLIARNDGANSAAVGALSGYQTGVGLGRVGESLSPIISLTAGTPYYLEGLLKEGGGGDYLEVVLRAIDPNTLLEIGGVPAVAAGNVVSGGFFSAPGNPDLVSVVSAPPAELFVTANDVVDLRVVALPASLVQFASAQWARSNANSAGFVNIPGATSLALAPFFVPGTDDGAAYRITANLPGGVGLNYTTLLHVTVDSVDPFIVSVSSLDGKTVGVCFNEPITTNSANQAANYYFNGNLNFRPLSAAVRASDPRTVLLTMPPGTPVSNTFILSAVFITDFATIPNTANSRGTGTVQNLTPLDIGAPPGAGSSWTCTNGEIDVIAGGADIWGTSDQGHFTIGTRTGDFDVWARVDSLSRVPGDNDGITKAGIMVRETLNADARKLTVLGEPPPSVGGRGFYEASQRPTIGAATAAWSGGDATGTGTFGIPNGWIRIKRVGDLFTAYRSSDGVNWVAATTQTMVFPATVYVGLAATAHIPSPSAGTTFAKFRNIHIPNPPTITVQPSPTNQTVAVGSSVSYSVTVSSLPDPGTLSYRWRHDGVVIASATAATLNIAAAQLSDSGIYTVEVFGDGGSVVSRPVTLTVTAALPAITPGSARYNAGAGTFSASLQTASGVTYTVEYKDNLNTVPWTTLPPPIVGDGTVKTFTDPGPLPPMRFYRVRVQ